MTTQDLQEVAELSGVLDAPDDFLSAELRTLLSAILPEPEKPQCNEFVKKYFVTQARLCRFTETIRSRIMNINNN